MVRRTAAQRRAMFARIANAKIISRELSKSSNFLSGLARSQRIEKDKSFPSSKNLLDEKRNLDKVITKIDMNKGLSKKDVKVVILNTRQIPILRLKARRELEKLKQKF